MTGEFKILTIAISLALASGSLVYGQDGRELIQPRSSVLQNQAPGIPSSSRPISSEQAYGLVPISPRGTANSAWQTQQQTRKPAIDEGTLSMLRSGKIEDPTDENRANQVEIIRTRYPNGKVQILKHVAQDREGNYFNHGVWRLYNEQGQVLSQGQFYDGLMEGLWQRWHPANSDGLFQTQPFNQFQGPYLSTATFQNGKLDGVWRVHDRNQRKILEIPYREGERHGTATWWYPTAQKMRQVNFVDGQLDGPLVEWDQQNKVFRNEEYIRGQKVVRNIAYFRPKQKESEAYFLDGAVEFEGEDNWWDAQPAGLVSRGARKQHGPVKAWHENGQLKMQGQYLDDRRVGKFTWWHRNGQRSSIGTYQDGLKVDQWTWWHENGMKSCQGTYDEDEPTGTWTWWDDRGQVVSTEGMTDRKSTGELVEPRRMEESDRETQLRKQQQNSPAMTPPDSGYEQLESIDPPQRRGESPDESLNLEAPLLHFDDDDSDPGFLDKPAMPTSTKGPNDKDT